MRHFFGETSDTTISPVLDMSICPRVFLVGIVAYKVLCILRTPPRVLDVSDHVPPGQMCSTRGLVAVERAPHLSQVRSKGLKYLSKAVYFDWTCQVVYL